MFTENVSELTNQQLFKLLEISNRIVEIQRRLDIFDKEYRADSAEAKLLEGAAIYLRNPIRDGLDLRRNVGEIERRITRLEQKLTNG